MPKIDAHRFVNISQIPKPLRTELLWCGFSERSAISEYMYKTIIYCRENDSLRLKQIHDHILDECKHDYRHAWSCCFGGKAHTVFGGSTFCWFSDGGDFDDNFKYWFTPILESNLDDPDVRKMLIDIDTEKQIVHAQEEQKRIEEGRRKEIIYQQKKSGFWGLFG